MRIRLTLLALLLIGGTALSADVRFTAGPSVKRAGDKVTVTFAVSTPTDVEVAVLDAQGGVVRHLAAGVLGSTKAPPEPLVSGLAQALLWDGKDDFGKQAGGGPFTVRVRAGTGVTFGRFIGADPYNFGRVGSAAADEDGNLYVLGGGPTQPGHDHPPGLRPAGAIPARDPALPSHPPQGGRQGYRPVG